MKIAPLIKLRENRRDQQLHNLLDAEHNENALRDRIRELERLLEQNLHEWRRTESCQPVPLEELKQLEAQRRELHRLQKEALAQLAEAAEATEEERARLSAAVREVRVLENLRDRKEQEAAVTAKKMEQRDLDRNGF